MRARAWLRRGLPPSPLRETVRIRVGVSRRGRLEILGLADFKQKFFNLTNYLHNTQQVVEQHVRSTLPRFSGRGRVLEWGGTADNFRGPQNRKEVEGELAWTVGRAGQDWTDEASGAREHEAEGWGEDRHRRGKHTAPRNGSRADGLLGTRGKSLCEEGHVCQAGIWTQPVVGAAASS